MKSKKLWKLCYTPLNDSKKKNEICVDKAESKQVEFDMGRTDLDGLNLGHAAYF